MVHKYSPIPYIQNCSETREDELYPLVMKISRQHSLNNFFYYQSLFSQTLTNPPKLLKRQIYKFLKNARSWNSTLKYATTNYRNLGM